eukprot:366555-Chlamydomonas_euryale.AAC.4
MEVSTSCEIAKCSPARPAPWPPGRGIFAALPCARAQHASLSPPTNPGGCVTKVLIFDCLRKAWTALTASALSAMRFVCATAPRRAASRKLTHGLPNRLRDHCACNRMRNYGFDTAFGRLQHSNWRAWCRGAARRCCNSNVPFV